MSTSQYGYYVAVDSAVQGAAYEPLDAASARVLFSNANHLCDEFAQVRVSFTDKTGFATTLNVASTDTPVLCFTFPISVRADGSAYPFRIRLGGYVTGGATAKLRAVIGPSTTSSGSLYSYGGYGDREFLTGNLAGASAWATGTSQGPTASATMIYLPSAIVRPTFPHSLDALAGNDTVTTVPTAQLAIYATSSSLANPPIITGIYLAEYIGT